MELRARIAAIAEAEIGTRDPERYYRDAAPCYPEGAAAKRDWCGIFALWCLRQAGLTDWVWKDVYGFIFRLGWGSATKLPRVGDICYVDAPYRHHAVVVRVGVDGITTVDGNSSGGVVAMHSRPVSAPGVVYYSIQRLVDAAQRDADTEPAPPPVPDPADEWPRILRRGDHGRWVGEWQNFVEAHIADDQFDAYTEALTRTWQRRNGLVADGIVGPLTRAKAGVS